MSDIKLRKIKHDLIDAIKKLKRSNNWTQLDMAKMTGFKQSNISTMLNKNTDRPASVELLIRLYLMLGGRLELILK